MRKFNPIETDLILFGAKFKTLEEFKHKAGGKYTIAKRKNLIKYIFPPHTCELPLDYVNPAALKALKLDTQNTISKAVQLLGQCESKVLLAQTSAEIDRLLKLVKKQLKEQL